MGFLGPERPGVVDHFRGGASTSAPTSAVTACTYMSSVPGVFVAGDAGRQSLIVWAIAEGRAAAAGVDAYLTGSMASPRPVEPTDRPLAV